MRYHLTPITMAIIQRKQNKTENNKCWQTYGEIETLVLYQWECKMMQPLWKTVWHFLKKTENRITIGCSNYTIQY